MEIVNDRVIRDVDTKNKIKQNSSMKIETSTSEESRRYQVCNISKIFNKLIILFGLHLEELLSLQLLLQLLQRIIIHYPKKVKMRIMHI